MRNKLKVLFFSRKNFVFIKNEYNSFTMNK